MLERASPEEALCSGSVSIRVGASGRGWAVQWLKEFSNHGLPGKDFVILAPLHDLQSFKQSKANFHCQPTLRSPLLHPGFTPSETTTLSLPSYCWTPTATEPRNRERHGPLGAEFEYAPKVRLSSVRFWTLWKGKSLSRTPRRLVDGWHLVCSKSF